MSKNTNNESCRTVGRGGFNIGYVDEVNGAGAQEVADFAPTRHELLQIAKYWGKVEFDLHLEIFFFPGMGSTESRLLAFAGKRLNRICDLLGAPALDKVTDELWAEFGRRDPRMCEALTKGDQALVSAVQEESIRHLMDACACPHVDENQNHETDWNWIEQEADLHRTDKCSDRE